MGCHVIRAKTVCPEYLYLYLSSYMAQKIVNVDKVPLADCSSMTLGGSLEGFPVVMPEEEESVYKERFLQLPSPGTRYYNGIESFNMINYMTF